MSSRTTLLVATAFAALTVAAPAQAQEGPPPQTENRGIGQEVRDIARDQDTADDQRGIGSEVREIASAQNDDTVDDDDDGTDGDTDDSTDTEASAGIGAEARAAAQDPAREGGVGAETSAAAQAQNDDKPEDDAGDEAE